MNNLFQASCKEQERETYHENFIIIHDPKTMSAISMAYPEIINGDPLTGLRGRGCSSHAAVISWIINRWNPSPFNSAHLHFKYKLAYRLQM